MSIALAGVAAVWALGAVWSFTEQHAFARAKGFADPALLPLVIDGFAVATACVAFAASLDGRPAVPARIGTAIAVLASAISNGWWAGERSIATGRLDLPTIVMGVCVPVFANIAFEVLLAESRRQVQRARGMAAPVAIPTLRVVRVVLAPWDTFTSWRRLVLQLTAMPEPVPATATLPDRGELTADPAPRHLRLVDAPTIEIPVIPAVPPRPEERPETQEPAAQAPEEPPAGVAETEPPPPALTGHKMSDARAWFLHELRHGRSRTATEVNTRIGSDCYVGRRHLRRWTEELEQDPTDDTGPQLRAVEG